MSGRSNLLAAVATVLAIAAPAAGQSVQYRSASGVEYRAQRDTGAIARAESALAVDPRNVERFIQLGVAQSGARQFREAIQTFTRGLAVAPNEPMLYRWRGHRYLSVREFDRAMADLTRGFRLDSTNYGILYHLGVLRYVRGDFAGAADAFMRAQPRAPDAGELAGATDWLWMSLSRAGRAAEAKAMLERRPDSLATAVAYAQRLKLYRGQIGPDEVVTPTDTGDVAVATLAYGVGNWYLIQGDTARARTWFERSIRSGGWPAFGFIAAEAELRRLRPRRAKAFTGLTLIDGTDRPPVANATLVVRDGRVVAAGASSRVAIPAGAERVALNGKTVIPGLINAHGHVTDAARDLATYAAYGVTTVYSLGGEPPEAFAARDAQWAPDLARARVFVAGPVLNPATPDEARAQVAEVAAQKVDIVKIRVDDNLGTTPKMPPAVYRAVIDAAHAQGLRVAVHLFYLADAKALLDAGADFVAHSVRDVDVDAELIAEMKAKRVCLSPTLMREVSTFVYESTPDFFADPLFLAHANTEWVSTLREPARQAAMRASPSAQRYKAALEVATRNVQRLADAGIPIAMGTDTGPTGRFQGYFELMELELMVKAGLTPRQALAAATRDAARCMKIDRELGTLEAGKWADFVVLDADPLANIANVRRIASVWVAGNELAR